MIGVEIATQPWGGVQLIVDVEGVGEVLRPAEGEALELENLDGSPAAVYQDRACTIALVGAIETGPDGLWPGFLPTGTYKLTEPVDATERYVDAIFGDGVAGGLRSILDYGVDRAGLVDQAAAISALEPGTYFVPNGIYRLYTEARVPELVNFIAAGPTNDPGSEGAVFLCSHANGKMTWETGLGGVSSGFCVDGNNIASNPLRLEVCVQRTFINIKVRRGTGHNLVLDGSQNNTFIRLESVDCGGGCVVFDGGAGSNYFRDSELNRPGTYHIISQYESTIIAATVTYPLNNVFDGGICEYIEGAAGCVLHKAGSHLRFCNGFNFAIPDATHPTNTIFTVEVQAVNPTASGNILIDSIQVLGAAGAATTTFLHVKGCNTAQVMIVTGRNYVAAMLNGIKYDAGVSPPIIMEGVIDYVSVTNKWVNADGAPEYAKLYGLSEHARFYSMPASDHPASRYRVRNDAFDRMTVAPNGLWAGSGAAASDSFFYRTAVSHWNIINSLGFMPCTAASVPVNALFVDSADNKLKYKDAGAVVNLLY